MMRQQQHSKDFIAGLARAGLTLRPCSPADLPLLFRIYAETRTEELAVVPWDDAQKHAFLTMQFSAQHQHYRQHFADATFDIIERAGDPIGRLYLDRQSDEIRIIDIALLTESRGHGYGGAILRALLAEAALAKLPVRIYVEQNNPALRLYDRLGFRVIGHHGIYYLMEAGLAGESDQR